MHTHDYALGGYDVDCAACACTEPDSGQPCMAGKDVCWACSKSIRAGVAIVLLALRVGPVVERRAA